MESLRSSSRLVPLILIFLFCPILIFATSELVDVVHSKFPTFTRLDFYFSEVVEYKLVSAEVGELCFEVSDVEVGKSIQTDYEMDDILVNEISIVPQSESATIKVGLHRFVRDYEAYLTVEPERLVVKVFHPPFSIEKRERLLGKIKRVSEREVLLVDDDDGVNNGNILAGIDVDDLYIRSLEKFKIPYTLKRVKHDRTGPDIDTLLNYDIVIWITGIDAQPTLFTTSDLNNISRYLDSGGKLLLISQNLLSDTAKDINYRSLLRRFGVEKTYPDTKIKTVSCGEVKVGVEDVYNLDTPVSRAGNWGDGMKLGEGIVPLLSSDDGLCYGLISGDDDFRAILYTVELANISDAYTLGHFILDSLNYLVEE